MRATEDDRDRIIAGMGRRLAISRYVAVGVMLIGLLVLFVFFAIGALGRYDKLAEALVPLVLSMATEALGRRWAERVPRAVLANRPEVGVGMSDEDHARHLAAETSWWALPGYLAGALILVGATQLRFFADPLSQVTVWAGAAVFGINAVQAARRTYRKWRDRKDGRR